MKARESAVLFFSLLVAGLGFFGACKAASKAVDLKPLDLFKTCLEGF